jgi:hypothetical protein
MVTGKVLIIEGTSDTRNGNLRQGFHKLLEQQLKGKMPRIVMGDGKNQAIKKFLNYSNDRFPGLLIDLDKKESFKEDDLKKNKLYDKSVFVYYMVQEMEAWFLSQPKILDSYYSEKISKKIPNRPAMEISKPSDLLYQITKTSKKRKYHKVVHAVDLLQNLDAKKLMEDFEDFKSLIQTLSN